MNKLLADFKRKPVVPTGQVNGAVAPYIHDEFSTSDEDEEDEADCENYEQKFVTDEMQAYAGMTVNPLPDTMSDVEGIDGIDYKNNPLNIYTHYNFNKSFLKKELPIDSFREKILHISEINNVLVIQGPTGCGKTTQVPQYILDEYRERNEYCNIAVTQPRRIATINVTKRVCEERGWSLGTVCGYQVGLEKRTSPECILTYMTTGVLLQKIIQAKSLHQYTHIVIDEIHERNQELDFLLLIIRRFLFTNSPRTKVILMSATIEAEDFAYYFRSYIEGEAVPAPIIYVTKQNTYTKTTFYLESLQTAFESTRTTIPYFEIDKPEISESLWKVFTFLVAIIDKLDAVDPVTNEPIIGSVLVFLPGIHEIEEADKLLRQYYDDMVKDGKVAMPIRWDLIPLHSSLPNDELTKAFLPAKPGFRKIILSTNIAESSITVPDSYYVIDFCMTKVMTVDPITKYSSLKLEWASHVSCDQRAGRVGRIGNGRVYRLVPSSFYNIKMPSKSIPEILRAPLERVVLQAKMLNLNDTPQQILALSLNPPNLKNIKMTILSLKESGGLLPTCNGKYTGSDGDVTFLGTVMASLPIDIHLSKLIVLGYLFSCLDETIIMAAGCSIQNIFSIPFQQRFNAYRKLLLWADGSFSDLIALLNLYQVWQAYKRDNHFESIQKENRWCAMNLVSLKGLREWHMLVNEIKQRLDFLNIRQIDRQIQLRHDEKPLILKIITAGAFYPNFYVKEPNTAGEGGSSEEKEAVKTVGGRNPLRTVYLSGMDPGQPGPLYIRDIKKLFRNEKETESNMSVGFDGSSKIYVEFKCYNNKNVVEQISVSINGRQMLTDTIPGRIPKEVYEAVRKRQLQYHFKLNLLNVNDAWSWAESNGFKRKTTLQRLEDAPNAAVATSDDRNCFTVDAYSPIPALDVQWIVIKITEHVDAGHFWVNHIESEIYQAKLEEILNKTVLHSVVATGGTLKIGKIYAARYFEDNLFYRCRVLSIVSNFVHVIFIDYGDIQQVKVKDVYLLPNRAECDTAPLGVECVLRGIQPAKKTNPKGVWSEESNRYWKEQTCNILLYGQVYSVVNDVVHLDLYRHDPKVNNVKSINQLMIDRGYAEPASESFLSKADHEKRLQVCQSENPSKEAVRLAFDKIENYEDFETPDGHCRNFKTITLKGPYSPLEMKMYGCIGSSENKTIDIDGTSVNTVLLDSEPQEYHTRLLVAGYVSQTVNGEKLRLRQTTLMPNIPGLPMLMALLFCPTMEAKLTEDGRRVAAVLCGLGCDRFTNKPLYSAHDLTLNLDTELNEDEINMINKVRFSMNQGIRLMSEISNRISSQGEMLTIQKILKTDLINLIYADRKPIERTMVKYGNVWGKNDFKSTVLKPNITNENDDVWPLLWFVKLNNTGEYDADVSKNLDNLESMARRMTPVSETECFLCKTTLNFLHEIRLHLITKEHKENVAEYYEQLYGVVQNEN
ncbi:probable ATP-dependent RNA helicase spindle-E [Diorhabda carinulata]|uniref:probable ATP-dependent RNA helicase spindle-E n=1 Tax=Diorhabda carinulata TaxID=1163345 RepID=UPI0025A05B6C|nr:probable ATP-dependent RNA helicase spindle-E [Diorhabda carinulata]